MWRTVCSQLAPWRYAAPGGAALRNRAAAAALRNRAAAAASISSSPSPSSFQKTAPLFSADSGNASLKKRVEDVIPIATGHERDEIEAELEGRKIFDMEAPVGPFGTKEAPAVIQSSYDRRIVGCSGGEAASMVGVIAGVISRWLTSDEPFERKVAYLV
ncbi:cytochrome c oxidase subunit 5b-1, mitochondrial-like [Phoenix dactylifera]|uniref:Cytochrome c oxidase subunit 5b-1, mitochondrial-like n=1 Tax=Phoenix dactylifera TaxID=42345 RepID=A0A8B9AMA9_PHODC|nr:cytochrome c oxidase subunit 5b-1, mitochondrial-like [Phoenix dactylifera]